ncbi:hypothetical protein HZS_2499 [Henneguya salminicola]|nr:hypothetical protein HZS_2499 [Henneguya salminicola]
MADDELHKNYIQVANSTKKRFNTSKNTEKSLLKLDEGMKSIGKDQEEFISMVNRVKCKCEKMLGKRENIYDNYAAAGRILFESIIKEIKNGFKFTHDQYTEAIENYEFAINELLEQKRYYMAGVCSVELAQYLKEIFKFDEAYSKFVKASLYFESFEEIKVMCEWQSIYCVLYSRDFIKLKLLLTNFMGRNIDSDLLFNAKVIYILTDCILNPCLETFKINCDKEQLNGHSLELFTMVKSLCTSYILKDLTNFLLLEDLVINKISLEQLFIVNEMKYRIEHKF